MSPAAFVSHQTAPRSRLGKGSNSNLQIMNIDEFDKYLVMFSGGKDSTACHLYLLEMGIPPEKIELWHQDVDGPGLFNFMDWPVTHSYCNAYAKAFNIPIYFSWRKGGFEREMLRKNQPTGEIFFETPKGLKSVGGNGPRNTRMRFPQISPDLNVRWCSAYLKIDVAAAAIRNQKRFEGAKTLVLTGERAEESPARAKYKDFHSHKTFSSKKKRFVYHYRPVLHWSEEKVWGLIEKYKVNPHPAYKLGFGRVSCAT